LFVQRNRLDAALVFLQHTLGAAGLRTSEPDKTFLALLEQSGCEDEFIRLRGTYCHHYPICVRKILPDDTLISMASNAETSPDPESDDTTARPSDQAWYSITLTNYHRGSDRKPFDDLASFVAKSMARLFGARPHWGKLCPLSSDELQKLYPAMDRFRDVCADADQDGAFANEWTESLFQTKTSHLL
jgi:hypothetical protein